MDLTTLEGSCVQDNNLFAAYHKTRLPYANSCCLFAKLSGRVRQKLAIAITHQSQYLVNYIVIRMCTKTFYAVITVYAIVLICYVLKHAKFSLTKLLIRSGEVLCVALWVRKHPVQTTHRRRVSLCTELWNNIPIFRSKVLIVILSLISD